MDRTPPRSTSDEIELYIRTYYSLLRSSGDVRVRAFEEAHIFANSSLHAGARDTDADIAAFAYSAARLPECFPGIERVVLGQSVEQFERAGLPVRAYERVKARGRRRPMRWDRRGTLAVFVTSASDIDDLVPIITAYQIEWNKLHARAAAEQIGESVGAGGIAGAGDGGGGDGGDGGERGDADPVAVFGLAPADTARLRAALGLPWRESAAAIAARPMDLSVRLLSGSFSQYQTSAQRWWGAIEPAYLEPPLPADLEAGRGPRRRPIYFVSSNTHSLVNLLGGYARAHSGRILEFARRADPEGLAAPLEAALRRGDQATADGLLYYLLRAYLHADGQADARLREVQDDDREGGIQSIDSPGRIDVGAQLIELSRLRPERLDPRVVVDGVEALAGSDAVIFNIDYPLGMAAYHHLSRVAQGTDEIRGVYIMGKAATLNGRVGDVLVSSAVYDEHSRNTYLLRNGFTAADVQPFMQGGTVLDNQKAVTVRSAFLQNRDYMSVFYDEGYTVLEMEAGPYLSAVYEIVSPGRHPTDQIVNLSNNVKFELGFLHYASDTPYSRRQELLSKSLSYFGVESTYGCAIAIARRIFEREVARLAEGLG